MSIESVKLRRSRQWGRDDKGAQKGHRVYLVKCTDKNDGPDVAAAACPQPGAGWSAENPFLVVTDLSADELDESGIWFTIAVNYATRSHDPSQSEPNPLKRAPQVSKDTDRFEEEVYKAAENSRSVDSEGVEIATKVWNRWKTAIVNSAGSPFNKSLTDTFRDPVLVVTRNEPYLPLDSAKEWEGRVNNDRFKLIDRSGEADATGKVPEQTYWIEKGQALVDSITGTKEFEGKLAFYAVAYRILIRRDGWDRKVLDEGLEEIPGEDPDIKKRTGIKDINGDPVRQPVLLNGKGAKLPVGSNPVFIHIPLATKNKFGDLNLHEAWDPS